VDGKQERIRKKDVSWFEVGLLPKYTPESTDKNHGISGL
jgi:hypothetical protein